MKNLISRASIQRLGTRLHGKRINAFGTGTACSSSSTCTIPSRTLSALTSTYTNTSTSTNTNTHKIGTQYSNTPNILNRNFSAAAQLEQNTLTRRTKKAPIIVTERAAARIKELLANPSTTPSSPPIGIRLGVKRRGCNGLSYTINYAIPEELTGSEEALESHGVKVFIEPMALFSVVGTVMDFEVTDMSSEFTFQNPNSKGECGCGESFNV